MIILSFPFLSFRSLITSSPCYSESFSLVPLEAPGEVITIRAPPPCRRTREELAKATCSAEERRFSMSINWASMHVLLGSEMVTKLNVSREGLILLGMKRIAARCESLLSAPIANVRIGRLVASFGVSHQSSFCMYFLFLQGRNWQVYCLCQPNRSAGLLTATAINMWCHSLT